MDRAERARLHVIQLRKEAIERQIQRVKDEKKRIRAARKLARQRLADALESELHWANVNDEIYMEVMEE